MFDLTDRAPTDAQSQRERVLRYTFIAVISVVVVTGLFLIVRFAS